MSRWNRERMWMILYNTILCVASPVILIILLVKKRCRRGMPERLGMDGWFSGFFGFSRLFGSARVKRNKPDKPDRPVVWIHAVSLGEVSAITPLVKRLKARYPHVELVVSTVTETGRQAVGQYLAGIATHCYAPLDFPWAVTRAIKRLNPIAYGFVETELWPNLLRMLEKRTVPTILLNGRVSSRSYRRYWLIRPFVSRMLWGTRCLMQSERDVERITALGANPAWVRHVGNVKFDQLTAGSRDGESALGRISLGLAAHEQLIVAGSIHQGEEEYVLQCYQDLVAEFPFLVLLVAPRHLERTGPLERSIHARNLLSVRRTALEPSLVETSFMGSPRVIILDTHGELASVYRDAVVTFVGGTLEPIGGHNLLEPAFWGRPVLFGPHTDHCADIVDLLVRGGGGMQVSRGEELAPAMTALLKDEAVREAMGRAARRVVLENQGATARHAAELESLIDRRLRALDAGPELVGQGHRLVKHTR